MKTILIAEILDKEQSYVKAGEVLGEMTREAISSGCRFVRIDMKGVDSFPTTFMNTSFGYLIDDWGIQKTKSVFVFDNILKSQMERIRKYFKDYESILNKDATV